jgi:opacity protein-like surface antigen
MPLGGVPSTVNFNDLDIYNGPAFGGRVGFWLKTHRSIGIAVDVTRFDTDVERQSAQFSIAAGPAAGSGLIGTSDVSISNTLVSFDLILRHRGERFSPYMFAGPGIMFADMDNTGALSPTKQEDGDTVFAYKAGVGISYRISDNMRLFTEYRYIHSSLDFNFGRAVDPLVIPANTVNAKVEIDTDTHFAVGGLSIRF